MKKLQVIIPTVLITAGLVFIVCFFLHNYEVEKHYVLQTECDVQKSKAKQEWLRTTRPLDISPDGFENEEIEFPEFDEELFFDQLPASGSRKGELEREEE